MWDGLTNFDSERLEKCQIEALRIITGLPIYCSHSSLYFETGLESLKERRKNRKLCLMYKIQNNQTPDYVSNLMPPSVSDMTSYNLRNRNHISTPFCRLNIYRNSFVPSSISMWNQLSDDVRNSESLLKFKSKINSLSKLPKYFNSGKRNLNIIHTRLRHGVSRLKYD